MIIIDPFYSKSLHPLITTMLSIRPRSFAGLSKFSKIPLSNCSLPIRGFHFLPNTKRPTKISDGNVYIPPYPYGPRQTFKEADNGLYGGAQLQSGNKISKGRNKGKTRRKWLPNVRMETLRSEALGMDLNILTTARCMRTIRKCGGLDQYLLGDKPARIKELGLFGWKLRCRILNTPMMTKRFEEERKKLDVKLPLSAIPHFKEAWQNPEFQAEVMQEQKSAWLELRAKDEKFQRHVKTYWMPKDKKKYEIEYAVPDPDLVASLARVKLPESNA
jgi:large subunit ribosomal protein L28